MACEACLAALPLFRGLRRVAMAPKRKGALLQCGRCKTLWEQLGNDWRSPREFDAETAAKLGYVFDSFWA